MGWHSTDGVTACLFSSRVWYFPNEKWAPPDGSGCASSARAEAHLCWGRVQGHPGWLHMGDNSGQLVLCCTGGSAGTCSRTGGAQGAGAGGSSCPNSLCCVRSSQLPSSFPLLGGNLWGKDLGAPVRVKSAPDLPCSRAAETSVPGCAHVLCR